MKKATIIIDYQNDFVSGSLGFADAAALEPGLCQLAQQTLATEEVLFCTLDTHENDYLFTREGRFLPVPHCIKGSEGWHLYGALRALEENPRVHLLEKPGFGSPDLAAALCYACGGEPDCITLAGVVTNICVLSNAVLLQTAFPHAALVVKGGLCAAVGDAHENALSLMRGLGITVE